MIFGQFFSHYQEEPHFNMGFDEWLLTNALHTPGFIGVRLYSWRIGAITFGFNQHRETALDWSRLGETPAIRRVTGGRALYHDQSEVTYAVAVNQQGLSGHPLGGSLRETSEAIAGALVVFLSGVGFQTDYERKSSAENAHPSFFHKAPCFASRAKYEILHDQQKIIASAQKRLSSCLLQHGAIKLRGLASHPSLPGVPGIVERPQGIPNSEEFAELAELLRGAATKKFGIPFRDGQLDESQIMLRDQIVAGVKKNPLGQREIIKQRTDANSL
jgi:lipoate-protein ligase A